MDRRFPLPLLGGAAVALVALPFAVAIAQSPRAPYAIAETGQTHRSLQDAVDAIGAGTGTIAIAPGHYADCAVQTAGDVTFVAEEPGKSVFDGKLCEGKAALVLRGRVARVSGLTFQNMASKYSGNGAGIRMERGELTITQSWFRASQQGILSADDAGGKITIDKSTFTNLGTCAYSAGCAHSVYIGKFGYLRVTRSRFEKGSGGHYLKSRSARVEIASNSFDDAQGHATNYMIDLPAGSTGQISNNWFVQGRDKENHSTFIAIAAESHDHSADGLTITANTARLAPGVEWSTAFVADWSGDRIVLDENSLGPGIKPFEKR